MHQYTHSQAAMEHWKASADSYNKEVWVSEWGNWWLYGSGDEEVQQAMDYASRIYRAMTWLQTNNGLGCHWFYT